MFARFVYFLTIVLVVASSGCATSVVTETTRLDGTVVRTTIERNIGFLEPSSYYGGGYAVLAPVYGSSYQEPIHVPSVKFGRMIRNNVRLVYVDGEARECDVRPKKTGSCYSGPENWGSAMMDRR